MLVDINPFSPHLHVSASVIRLDSHPTHTQDLSSTTVTQVINVLSQLHGEAVWCSEELKL